jgi:hypothetical protein
MIETIINEGRIFLEKAVENRSVYFSSPKDFTRTRKLDYCGVALTLVNLPRKSLSVELEEALERLGSQHHGYTKSAFSHARSKLQSCFFKDWYEHQNQVFYRCGDYQTWNGFKLMGIDGSRGYLPNTPRVVAEFGTQDNQHGKYPMCQYLFGHDLLNNLCLYSDLSEVNKSETAMLLPWLDQFSPDMLCIYDRLFVSTMLCYLHIKKQIPFVMRCKLTHNQVVKDFVASQASDEIVAFNFTAKAIAQLKQLGYKVSQKETVTVRLVRVILDSGETEVLVTSLIDQDLYPPQVFKSLYGKRWGVETAIGCLKNQLQLEIVSGQTPLAIKQDFFASIFTYNLQSMLIHSVQPQVEQINQERQHNYQVNRNVSLGILKGRMIRLFIHPIPNLIELLQNKFIANLTECKKGQGIKNPRNKKAQRMNGKYRPLTNYKRAI